MKNSNMPTDLVTAKVLQLIQEQLRLDDHASLNCAASLQELGLDSLDLVELVIKLEDLFKRQISDEQAQLFLTPIDIVNYLS